MKGHQTAFYGGCGVPFLFGIDQPRMKSFYQPDPGGRISFFEIFRRFSGDSKDSG